MFIVDLSIRDEIVATRFRHYLNPIIFSLAGFASRRENTRRPYPGDGHQSANEDGIEPVTWRKHSIARILEQNK